MRYLDNARSWMCCEPCGCGSPDCAECFPELQEFGKCGCCGAEVRLWSLSDYGICKECESESMRCCDWCGEWQAKSEMIEGYCLECYSTEIKDKEKAV